MKITNKAIETIAKSIYDETFRPLKEKEDKLKEIEISKVKLTPQEQKIVDAYNKAKKEYEKLLDSYKVNNYWGSYPHDSEILGKKKKVFEAQYKTSIIPTMSEVESVVIIATVDAKDMKDLIAAVKSKYKV